jgi:hypothetical protein
MHTQRIILPSDEALSADLVEKIQQLNKGNPDFHTYSTRVRDLFCLPQITISEKELLYLAGFIEGEGSVSISLKKNRFTPFGVEIDPVFNITQHINGVNHLYLALEVFKTGRIRYKTGSNATLVFVIEPRESLEKNVCPYYDKNVYPLSSPAKQIRYTHFKKILKLFSDEAHLDRSRMINEMLPLWDEMRMQRGYKGETFASLKEAQEYVRDFKK